MSNVGTALLLGILDETELDSGNDTDNSERTEYEDWEHMGRATLLNREPYRSQS